MKFDMATLIKLLSAAEAEISGLKATIEEAEDEHSAATIRAADLLKSNVELSVKNDRLQDELVALKNKTLGLVDPNRLRELEAAHDEKVKRINGGLLLEGFKISSNVATFKEQIRALQQAGAVVERIHVVKNLHTQGLALTVAKEFVDKNWPSSWEHATV